MAIVYKYYFYYLQICLILDFLQFLFGLYEIQFLTRLWVLLVQNVPNVHLHFHPLLGPVRRLLFFILIGFFYYNVPLYTFLQYTVCRHCPLTCSTFLITDIFVIFCEHFNTLSDCT